jgi:cytochrome c peroxidase
VCGDTRFDRGELDEAQTRGRDLFLGKAGCASCHTPPHFTDGQYHDLGIEALRPEAERDKGRGGHTKAPGDDFKFRTPSLRNVARTAPYFHDGSVATLEAAVRFVAKGGSLPPEARDPKMRDLGLADAEVGDLVAFLGTLDCPGTLEVLGDPPIPGSGL